MDRSLFWDKLELALWVRVVDMGLRKAECQDLGIIWLR